MIGLAQVPVMLFARAPEAGKVKTRLTSALGEQGAADLYERFVRQAVENAVEADLGPVTLWTTPNTQDPFFSGLRQEYSIDIALQEGADLGERMSFAFRRCLSSYPAALLLGPACRSLTVEDLQSAARILKSGSDAVLIPALDGGYVLLGLRGPVPDVFSQVPWGTDSVLAATRAHLRKRSLRWTELPSRRDIDRPADLAFVDAALLAG
ncbi:MAG: hypothetical protein DRQ37_00360 [Gammaproteobacteria bacterium]|nr:MAG: hypothetical protein DRQ37_00360 [Gammaproteobacteria bacterium]